MANTLESLTITPTGAALGAEVRGIDLAQAIPGDVQDALRRAWADHLILQFRGQTLSDDQLVEASKVFGGVQVAGSRKFYEAGGHAPGSYHMSRLPEITMVTNIGPEGKPVQKNDGLGSLEVDWHSDNSYVEVPPAGSLLYALQVPVDGGGETSFSNQYLAYETLSDDLKRAIEGKSQVHDCSRNSAGVVRPSAKLPATWEEVTGPTHPLVRVHPASGRKALYLGRRRTPPGNYILGMPYEESQALLEKLWAHATQWTFAWTHEWQAGDAILWDNRCALHHRKAIDDSQPRVMWRTQIKGEPIIAAARAA
ncbi:MAG: TauD/TfdA family dioxygenase [Rhodospirillales bacterium]